MNINLKETISKTLTCEICGQTCKSKYSLKRHIQSKHSSKDKLKCNICLKDFKRKDNLFTHLKNTHTVRVEYEGDCRPSTSTGIFHKRCDVCKVDISSKAWTSHIRTFKHKKKSLEVLDDNIKVLKSAFKGRIQTLVYGNKDEGNLDPHTLLLNAKPHIFLAINKILEINGSLKFNIELFGEYIKLSKTHENDAEEELITSIKSFHSKLEAVYNTLDLTNTYEKMCEKIFSKMSEFQERDSGWSLIRLIHIEINVNKFSPLKGAQYVELSETLQSKHACVNIQNSDPFCFKWAVISALYPVKNRVERTSSYEVDEISASRIVLKNNFILNFEGLEFPFDVTDVAKFEHLNPNISVNVFGWEEENKKIIGPFYATKQIKPHHINLLFIQEDEKNHYVWIKNISRYKNVFFLICVH